MVATGNTPSRNLLAWSGFFVLPCVLFLGVTLLPGCGSKTPPPPSDTEQQANKLRIESQRALLAGEVEEAATLLDDALGLAQSNAQLYLERADVYALQGRLEDAADAYDRARILADQAKVADGLPEAALGSALVHQAMGATVVFRNKLELAREGFGERLARLEEAEGGLDNRDADDAPSRDQIATRANLAYIQALSGDPSGGLQAAQELLRLSPGNDVVEKTIQAIQGSIDGTALPKELGR